MKQNIFFKYKKILFFLKFDSLFKFESFLRQWQERFSFNSNPQIQNLHQNVLIKFYCYNVREEKNFIIFKSCCSLTLMPFNFFQLSINRINLSQKQLKLFSTNYSFSIAFVNYVTSL